MRSIGKLISAVTVILAVLGTSTLSSFTFLSHPTCTAKHHDCGKMPTITTCCCGDEQSSSSDSTPVQSRVEVRVNLSALPAFTVALQLAMTTHGQVAVQTSPPHPALDRPTLFSSLLI